MRRHRISLTEPRFPNNESGILSPLSRIRIPDPSPHPLARHHESRLKVRGKGIKEKPACIDAKRVWVAVGLPESVITEHPTCRRRCHHRLVGTVG